MMLWASIPMEIEQTVLCSHPTGGQERMDRDVQFDSSLGWKTKTTIDELKVISTSKTWFKPSMGERAVNKRARVEWRRRKWVLSENSKTLKQKCHQLMDQKK